MVDVKKGKQAHGLDCALRLAQAGNTLKVHHLQQVLAWACVVLSGAALAAEPTAPPASASAASEPAAVVNMGPATRIKRHVTTYTVEASGAFTEQREWAVTVLKPQALGRARRMGVSFDPRLQKAEVIEAYTRKADGRRIDAPKAEPKPANQTGAEGRSVLTVQFPEVALDDTVVLTYRLTSTQPLFPRQFSVDETLSRADVQDDVRVRIDTPASMWTQHHVRGLREVMDVEKDGRRVVEWAWDNKEAVKPVKYPDSAIVDGQKQPGYALSTFKTYADIAKAYGARARLQPTERARKLADLIIEDQKAATPREVARALSQWVAVNIASTGACLTPGATVPKDLDAILEARSGDCTDHAALLQALLAAKGIDSTQALLNGDTVYQLPKVPTLKALNLVINYIPSLGVFVDPNADNTPFGMLPFADEDKAVFLVDGHQEGLRTPKTPLGFNRQLMKTTITIRPDGSVKGQVDVALRGMFAVNARSRLRNLSADQDTQLVKGFFESSGLKGSGTLVKDDLTELKDTFGYRATFDVQKLFKLPGAGRFPVAPLFYSESPVADYLAAASQDPKAAAFDTACSNGHSEEAYRYELPPRMKIVSLPKDVRLDSDTLSYSATYQLKGRVLTVKRVFDDRTPGNVCTPAMAEAYRQFAAKAVADTTAEVVFK